MLEKFIKDNPDYFSLSLCTIIIMLCLLFPVKGQALATKDKTAAEKESDVLSKPGQNLSFKQSIEYALEHNPRIRAAKFEVKKADSDIGSARSRFLPSLSMNMDYSDLNSISADGPTDVDYIDQNIGTASLQAVQTLFAGLTVLNTYQKAKLNKELAKVKKDREEMRLVLDVQTHFLSYLKAREDVQSLEGKVKRLKQNLQAAKSFFEQEMAPYVQVLQAEVDLADARQELSKAKNTVQTEKVQLNSYLNLAQDTAVNYDGDLDQLSYNYAKRVEDCLDFAFQNRPEILVAKKSLAIAEQEVDIALGRFSPKLQLSSNYYFRDRDYGSKGTSITGESYDRDQRNEYWTVGMQLKWPLFEGGRKYYEYTKSKQELFRIKEQLISTRNQVQAQVRSNYMNMLNAGQRIESTKKAIQEAEESYARSKKRYLTKMGSLPELLDAQIRLTRAEMNHNQALADYQISLSRLYYAMGKRNFDLSID